MLSLLNEPWAIRPDYAKRVASLVVAEWFAAAGGQQSAGPGSPVITTGDQIAVMRLFGTMTQHGTFWGGPGMEAFGRAAEQLVRDPSVAAIVVEINSPGGTVAGTEELAAKMAGLRGTKPIMGHVNSQMASAALWVGSSLDWLSASPGAEAGSLGVLMIHEDWSKALESQGVKVTMLATPAAKVEGNPFEPLTEDARAYFEAQNKTVYDKFVKAVAGYRNLSQTHVREKFGGGRMLLAEDALKVGMIDRIETLDALVGRLKKRRKPPAGYAASQVAALALLEAEAGV